MANWYVLFVMGGYEEKVKDTLIREGYDAFLPKKVILYRKERRYIRQEKLMFPGYVFVESEQDYVSFDSAIRILKMKITGILRNLKYDNEGTTPLTSQEVQLLERLLGKKKVVEHSIGVIEGDKIIITEGPLMGFESQIVHIDRHKRLATLELDMLGDKRLTKVSLEIISKV